MSRVIRNWIVRPLAWALPVLAVAHLLGVDLTLRVLLLIVWGSLIDSAVDYLIPHLKRDTRRLMRRP